MNWPILMGGAPEGGGGMYTMIWFGLIFVLMYMLLIRPQKKKQKEHEQLLEDLKKGDKIVTSGGMFGTISSIDSEKNKVVIKVNDVKFEFLKSSIAGKVEN